MEWVAMAPTSRLDAEGIVPIVFVQWLALQ
jgi:hypothetical protein